LAIALAGTDGDPWLAPSVSTARLCDENVAYHEPRAP
jgi:hypothetical protein